MFLTLLFSHALLAQETAPVSADTSRSSLTWTVVGASGAVLITAVLIHNDQKIYDRLYAWRKRNRSADKTSPVVTNMGDGAFSIGLFGGFAGYGWIFNDKKALEVSKIGLESFLLTGVTVQLIKNLCGRERPSAATRPGGFWHGPFSYLHEPKGGKGIASFDAFPSGHTCTVFSAATTISDFYTEPWVSYVSYSLATITAVSRVTQSTHWLSDCFVGAIIGYYGTKLVEHLNYGDSRFTLQPKADEYQYGFVLSVKL